MVKNMWLPSEKRLLLVNIWWFAIISISGDIAYMEYRTEQACKVTQRAYQSIHTLKVTTCTWKGYEYEVK